MFKVVHTSHSKWWTHLSTDTVAAAAPVSMTVSKQESWESISQTPPPIYSKWRRTVVGLEANIRKSHHCLSCAHELSGQGLAPEELLMLSNTSWQKPEASEVTGSFRRVQSPEFTPALPCPPTTGPGQHSAQHRRPQADSGVSDISVLWSFPI